jgi:hypothetical protein
MRFYLTYNQQARLFSWLQRNKKACIRLTGENPLMSISRLLAPMDLGMLPVAHAEFPDNVQWWIDRNCPYPYVKSGKRKKNLALSIKNWYQLKIKKQ